MNLFAGAIIDVASEQQLETAKELGENVSYEDNDRFIEAYKLYGKLYVVAVRPIGPKE